MPTFVIAIDRDPYSDEDSTAEDVVKLTADSVDSPIQTITSVGDAKDYSLIKSYIDDYPDYTPRLVVGLFGVAGMYREVSE